MSKITETQRINAIVTMGANERISDKHFLELEISKWKDSDARKMQIVGEAYYGGEHDITNAKRKVIGKNGELKEVHNLPNNRFIDNQYAKMVDQKTNYLVGSPFTVTSDQKEYDKTLNKYFNNAFMRTFKSLTEDALNQGIGWLFPYRENGTLMFKKFESYEIKPFWKDSAHTELDFFIRLFEIEAYTTNGETEKIEKVEVYSLTGIDFYILDKGLKEDKDKPHQDYLDSDNWGRIPLIPFKYNNKEIPLIKRVKSLQDGINKMLSDFGNRMQEDTRNTILVLENYDGQDLGEFRDKLSQYGAVHVRTEDGAKGGVTTLTLEFSSENYDSILKLLKKALIENARGYDAKDDRLMNSPNQMNIQSMYSDIDLDANGMEIEFQAALEQVIYFINKNSHIDTNVGDSNYKITFNRNVLINTTDLISNCKNSVGMISNKTILERHPFVEDVQAELDQIEKESSETDEYQDTFAKSKVKDNE